MSFSIFLPNSRQRRAPEDRSTGRLDSLDNGTAYVTITYARSARVP